MQCGQLPQAPAFCRVAKWIQMAQKRRSMSRWSYPQVTAWHVYFESLFWVSASLMIWVQFLELTVEGMNWLLSNVLWSLHAHHGMCVSNYTHIKIIVQGLFNVSAGCLLLFPFLFFLLPFFLPFPSLFLPLIPFPSWIRSHYLVWVAWNQRSSCLSRLYTGTPGICSPTQPPWDFPLRMLSSSHREGQMTGVLDSWVVNLGASFRHCFMGTSSYSIRWTH